MWRMCTARGLALAVFSASALKCRARDAWVGWDFRHQYGRLHLVSNNTRLLILPGQHYRNLGSRVLGLCARRIVRDWPVRFGHALLRLETYVDPARFRGTVYRGANWQAVGHSRGFRRDGAGYGEVSTPKRVFLYPLARDVRQQLSGATLGSHPAQRSAEDHGSVRPRCVHFPISSKRSMIRAPARGGAIPCTAPSRLRRPRRCAAPAATRPIGRMGRCARPQSAGPLRGPAPQRYPQTAVPVHHPHHPDERRPGGNSTARCNAGTSNTAGMTRRSPSTARRCATPSTNRACRPMS